MLQSTARWRSDLLDDGCQADKLRFPITSLMSPTRREVLAQLAILVAPSLACSRKLPQSMLLVFGDDPLDGTIASYQAGRQRGEWTAAQVTARALDRCRTDGMRWRAVDTLAETAPADARAADARLRAGRSLGPLDGVPVFAKA